MCIRDRLHPYLQLQETANGQRLAFTAELPAGSGDRVQLVVERHHREGVDPERGQGTFEFRIDRLNLAEWPSPLPFAAGQAAVEIGGDWRDWRPFQLQGRLRLEPVSYTHLSRSPLRPPL